MDDAHLHVKRAVRICDFQKNISHPFLAFLSFVVRENAPACKRGLCIANWYQTQLLFSFYSKSNLICHPKLWFCLV